MENKIRNRFNRFVYLLGLDYLGPKKWGWFIIPNFIWNSGLGRRYRWLQDAAEREFK